MRCKRIRDLLSPYMDKMTDEQETQAVEAHLGGCASCREELQQLKSLCHMMHELESPALSDTAVQDLHQRLLEEHINHQPVAIGLRRKPKWIAAVAASLLMAMGIYASGFLPVGNLALWFKDYEKEAKPSVAIEEPVAPGFTANGGNPDNNPIGSWQQEDKPKPGDGNGSQVEEGPSDQPISNNSTTQPPANNVNPPPHKETPPRIAQACSARVSVEDTAESLARIIQIADASSGIEFVSTSNNSAQIMSVTNTREVVFKLDKNKLDSFLSQLGNLGTISTPVYNDIVLTEEFSSIENKISGLEQEIQTLESVKAMSADDESRLDALKQQLKESSSKKGQLEKQLNTVSISIYLVEAVNS